MKRAAAAFGAGLLFGLGLVVSGMVDPRRVVGFLDFAGRWDPRLAGVMIGAIGVHAALLRARRGAALPSLGPTGGSGLDGRLVLGAAIFGVGWGLAGYCPGPAVVTLGFGAGRGAAFVAAMLAGALLGERLSAARSEAEGPGREDCGLEPEAGSQLAAGAANVEAT